MLYVISQPLSAAQQRWHLCLHPSQLKLVLDLVTLEGCKAELTLNTTHTLPTGQEGSHYVRKSAQHITAGLNDKWRKTESAVLHQLLQLLSKCIKKN